MSPIIARITTPLLLNKKEPIKNALKAENRRKNNDIHSQFRAGVKNDFMDFCIKRDIFFSARHYLEKVVQKVVLAPNSFCVSGNNEGKRSEHLRACQAANFDCIRLEMKSLVMKSPFQRHNYMFSVCTSG